MHRIYAIGDIHTVSALRLAGLTGRVCDRDTAAGCLEDVVAAGDAGIVLITQKLAADLEARITEISLTGGGAVIIPIPGIDEPLALGRSVVSYIAEALGMAM
jgi:vacuolar-type H+-ATPase subunit F/Vma7